MGESSGDLPGVRVDSGRRDLRRWEDKALVAMMTLLVTIICFMWKAEDARLERLEILHYQHDTRIAVNEKELSGIKAALERLITRLDKVLEEKQK